MMSPMLASPAVNSVAIPAQTRSDCSLQNTYNTYKAALEHARRLSVVYGEGQIETALAWETVEELTKAQRHHQMMRRSNFELYCLANPDAPEARIYDV